MKTIYVVRHAKAEGQPREAQLTPDGKQQAEELIQFFRDKSIDRIFSSPFIRAVKTISPLAESLNIAVTQDERLAERVLSSMNYPDWKEKLRASFENFDLIFEGGESNQSGYERSKSILEEILSSDDRTVILVTHGNLMTLLLRYFNEEIGLEHLLTFSNPDIYEITIDDNQYNVKRIWQL